MNLHDAHNLANQKMAEYGLTDWTFRWQNRRKVCGSCYHTLKQITLSKPITAVNSEEHVLDTILHEIAHALAGPYAGHGPIWKAQAAAIGARPVACSGPEKGTVRPEGKWVGKCASCDEKIYAYRRPTGTHVHIACKRAGKPAQIEWRENVERTKPQY